MSFIPERPAVRYAAHSVSRSGGGMERMGNTLIRLASSSSRPDGVRFSVEASEGIGEVAPYASVVPRDLPTRPALARIWKFWCASTSGRLRSELVHTCGAISRGHADIVTVHLVHASAPVARGESSLWRYANARLARRLGLALERRMYRPSRTRLLVAVSDAVANDLATWYPEMTTVVIENGVDLGRFPLATRNSHGPLRVVMVTGDFALKGVSEAIRAVSLIENVELTIVGDGPIAAYREFAERNHVADRVRFTGFLDDPRGEYAVADVVLCLSAYESFGLYLVEAALTGCAVVSTDVGVARRLIGEGAGGALLTSREPNEVAAALSLFANDRPRAHRAGHEASRFAQQFSESRMADQYLALYEAFDVRRPSVLHVGLESPDLRMGGLNRYLSELDSAQNASGVCSTTHVVALGGVGTASYTSITPSNWLVRLRAFRRAVQRSSAAVIDVHFAAHAAWAVASGALRDRPLVVHFQGPWSQESRWAGGGFIGSWLKARVEGYVLRRADRVIVLSRAFRDVVIRDFHVAPHRIHVIAPGLDVHTPQVDSGLRAHHNIPADAPVVVSVRRLVPRMGLDTILWVLNEPEMSEVHYVVVGTGPSMDDLRELAHDLGVGERVHFVGLVSDEDRDAWLALADVSVVPSLALEGFGLSVLESLAVGTPVIASRLGGLIDAAQLSPYVQLVSPSLTSEWSDALHDALVQRPLPADVQASVSHLTWESVAQRTASVYGELIAGSARERRQVVVMDHTAKRSGGELAMVRTAAQFCGDPNWGVHVVLFEEGDIEADLDRNSISYGVVTLPERTRNRRKDALASGLATSIGDSVIFVARLRRHLRSLRPAVVHTNSLKSFVLGSLASVGAPWRVVSHVRDVWSPPYLSERTSRLLRLLVRLRSDAVIANSSVTARASLPSAVVIPSPVDPSMSAVPAPTSTTTLRVGIIGRLAPWKGQDLFLDALDLLDDIAYEGVIVGDALFGESTYRVNLEHRVATMGGRVRMLGAVTDVAGVLKDCDVVVLGSRSPEPFGNVVTEAMAAGRLVVVPRQGGVMDFIDDRRNGFFYEPNNEQSLADVLRAIAAGRVDRAAIGSAARESAAAFSAPSVAEKVRRVYELVVE